MVGKFYLGKRLKLSEVEFKKPERSVSRIQFADPQLSSDFAAYHYKHAVLECVTTRENLSKRKAGVRKVWIDEEMAVYVKPEDWELNLPL